MASDCANVARNKSLGTSRGIEHGLREALDPLLREVESLNERIQEYDRRIEKMAKKSIRRRRCSNK